MAVLTGIAPQALWDVDLETFNFIVEHLSQRK